MNVKVCQVTDAQAKARICSDILHALPGWFGIEEAIQEYVEGVQGKYFLAAFKGEQAVSFISVKEHNAFTSEIYVLGVLREYHRMGIGRRLVSRLLQQVKESGAQLLTVKTLSASHPDEGYAATRHFYTAMGFVPVEEFKTLWGPENPCLLMAKVL